MVQFKLTKSQSRLGGGCSRRSGRAGPRWTQDVVFIL